MVQQGYFQENNWKGEFFNKANSIKDIAKLKKSYDWLKEVDSIALQASVENLGAGYDKYYKKQVADLNLSLRKMKYNLTLLN